MEDTKTKVFCKLTETRYALKPGTKGAWQQTEQEIQDCDEQMHRRIVDAAPFFRRLGGSEHLDYGYFSQGYLCYRIISKSPDRQTKVVREFDFGN